MKQSTGIDIQRATFVDNLYKKLRQQTASAIEERERLVCMATSLVKDGLSDEESIELMMIEAEISREAASGYVIMSRQNEPIENEGDEYSFQFADVYGKVWSSNDIGKTVFASTQDEAWEKAESLLFDDSDMEPQRILSVDRIA